MKQFIRFSSLACFSMLMGVATFGQNSTGPGTYQSQDHSAKSVAGCLQAGDKAGEYSINEANGNVWTVKSKKVDLSQHVGQQVRVTGHWADEQSTETPDRPGAKQVDGSGAEAPSATATNRLDVKSLKMISSTCSAK